MKAHRRISIDLPEDLILAHARAARGAGAAPSDFLRDRLAKAVGMLGRSRLSRRALSLLASLFEAAEGWLDLQTRLRAAGFVLRPEGKDTLVLQTWPLESRLLALEELDQSLASPR